ncbi:MULTISPECIES: orotidine-5'-phosphate decarboxylase [Vagococcus]|uniref:Orotidine 5'-phosphate decarboxylase n=1 Tax=Vagococcus fluvialis bH819 TaxID=1255619 RepID=A0A1X6WNI1_9ENTE|nr:MULTISPECIES: orotidine-5'-phosphate decarboxylase [Vagococcus]SLM85829.1 Orotidine 5'-phosphate decarboxylase [Vagococcus fluvialis bH819]HCM90251.1 orotidine-5'-phosphate decarboxylase [Vagococcus sp.]
MKRPIIALDFPSKVEVDQFLTLFPNDEKLFVKIGMELFYREGPSVVRELTTCGHDVFLDLKLHDIPNTVKSAMKNIASLGVAITNVHAAGGREMMIAALEGLKEGAQTGRDVPKLIAVTQLTSTSEEQMQSDQLIKVSLEESVAHYAKMTELSGLDGVVCSALEVSTIRDKTSENFICLTPGIRPSNSEKGDQKRVMTPSQAKAIGSSYIVVGRPITQSETPYESYVQIKNEWNGEK